MQISIFVTLFRSFIYSYDCSIYVECSARVCLEMFLSRVFVFAHVFASLCVHVDVCKFALRARVCVCMCLMFTVAKGYAVVYGRTGVSGGVTPHQLLMYQL